ncbi:MAG: glycogen/starch synthase [Myxococcales bacterium]|nr:glycogen/starch synthase [Myxococcales bacterium]
MKVLLITPEIAPYSRASSLAETAAGLPKALRGLGHQVTVVSPLYEAIDPNAHTLARRLSTIDVELGGETYACAVYDGRTTGGVDLVFLGNEQFGDEPETADDAQTRRRALLFGQAAAEIARTREPTCDVVHAFGFQAALSLPIAKAKRTPLGAVLSLFQTDRLGRFEPGELEALAPPAVVSDALSGTDPTTLLSAGILAADRVVAGSPGLAAALVDGSMAADLGEALRARGDRLTGIIDGVDGAVYNPVVDPNLTARFDPADTSGKDECKGALQYELGLPIRPDTPLLAVKAEDGQGGVAEVLKGLLRNDVQVALAIPDGPDAALGDLVDSHDEQVKCINAADEGAVHRLFGGADLFWAPTEGAEPGQGVGGLHLAAQRYGALPIVARTGPPGETVVDCDAHLETGTGFLYDDDRAAMLSALQRALAAYANTDAFEALRRRAMRHDTSWERAARRFEHVYRSVTE